MSQLISGADHFGFVLSIFIFLLAVQIKLRFKLELLNPLLVSTIIIIVILLTFKIPYDSYLEGADILNYFLTPATVCLAIPLYKQFSLLKNNFKAVFCAVLLPAEHIATLLPKSITTAIGLGISESISGYVNLTVASIVLTGIIGGILSDFVFKILPIHHPIARGLALGTSAHAIGTAKALEMGEIEGAMSSLSIVLAGIFTVILVPIVYTIFL